MIAFKTLDKIIGAEETTKVQKAMDALTASRIGKYNITDIEKRHCFVLGIFSEKNKLFAPK